MRLNRNRIFSALLAAIYLIIAMIIRGARGAAIVALFLIMPLACIWFADAMGGYEGPTTSPAVIVRILGWLLLLLPAIVAAYYALVGFRS